MVRLMALNYPGKTGGESEIRTHEGCYTLHAFQACAFNHSAISPRWNLIGLKSLA